ncbi:MAG: DUF4249 domain-containing protein [Bacteroidota bacterium]
MKTIKLFLSLCIVLALTSCEDVIQVKLDQGTPLLNVDAFVNDMRSQQKVRLTYTDNYFSQKANEPVHGATVNLRDLTDGIDYIFTDDNNGNYVFNLAATDTLGRVGHRYELTITHDGNVFKSNSRMARTAQVDSLIVEYREAGSFGGEAGYRFSFLGTDPVGDTSDFYWIKSYRNGVFFNRGGDINICENAAFGAGADGLIFITPVAEGITPGGERFQKNDVCRAEIHSINLETYNFLNQVFTQTTNSGLFATSPENIKTNITNTTSEKVKVVGWFCMSAVGFRERVAE